MQSAIQQIQRYSAQEEPIALSWSIDRIPNPNYLNDIINNNYINNTNYRINDLNNLLPHVSAGNFIQHNIYNDYNASDYIINHYPENQAVTVPIINVVLDNTLEITVEEENCCICFEEKEKSEICKLICNHTFCGACLDNTIKTFKNRNVKICCPLCRDEIRIITVQTDVNRELLSKYY